MACGMGKQFGRRVNKPMILYQQNDIYKNKGATQTQFV